jgi:hypothetical protein
MLFRNTVDIDFGTHQGPFVRDRRFKGQNEVDDCLTERGPTSQISRLFNGLFEA